MYVSRRFYPDVIGGGQISAYHMAKAVSDLGHDVSVLTFTTGRYSEEALDGIKVFRFPIFHVGIPLLSHFLNLEGMYVQIAYRSWRFVKKIRPDIVHFLNYESSYMTSWILEREKIPLVETINAPWVCGAGNCVNYEKNICLTCSGKEMYRCFMKRERSGLAGRVKGLVKYAYRSLNMAEQRFFERRIDRFFPISNALKDLFVRNGYDEKKLKVIPLILSPQEKVETDLKQRLGIKPDDKVILCVGRVTEDKGVHRAVEAMRYVKGAVLLVIGRGSYSKVRTDYYKSLEKMAEEYGLKDKVRFIGYVDPKDLKEYYSIAYLTVSPCWWFEGFSRTLLESCAYGVPAIATDVGGISDVIEDGGNGILLKTTDTEELVKAIESLLMNPEAHEKMSRFCIEKVAAEFSPERVGKDQVSEYESLIKKKAGR